MANILLIEDDLDARDLLGRFLSQAGHDMLTAANGWEGLLALERSVDLILLDLMLPGMDGFSFLRILRRQQNTRNIPVVAVTALNVADVAPELSRLGVTDVISKGPNLFPQLKSTLHRHVDPPPLHSRTTLPGSGNLVRPFLDLYLNTLGCV